MASRFVPEMMINLLDIMSLPYKNMKFSRHNQCKSLNHLCLTSQIERFCDVSEIKNLDSFSDPGNIVATLLCATSPVQLREHATSSS